MEQYQGIQKPLWRLHPAERKTILLVGDIFFTVLALLISLFFWARADNEWLNFSWQFIIERPPFWYYLLPFLWMLMLSGLYDIRRASNRSEVFQGVGMAAIFSAFIYLFIFFLSAPNSLPRLGVAIFFVAVTLLTLLWRLIYIQVFTTPTFLRRILIVGAGRAGTSLMEVINSIWPIPFYVVGFIDDDPEKIGSTFSGVPVIGKSEDLLRIIEEKEVADVIFSISGNLSHFLVDALLKAEEEGIEVSTMPKIYEELLGRVPIYLLQPDWLLRSFVDEVHNSRFYELSKRLIDIAGSLIGGVALVVLFPIIASLILLDGGAPIFYSQIRLGKNGKPFRILKFRTMTQDAEKDGKARPAEENDERVTHVGKLLRKSHLDEIPQVINILRGEMSFVGPRSERPEIVEELQKSIPFYRARLFVKPGLTGWAQVNYGYASGAEQNAVKLEYDLYYIKRRTFMMDISILFQTFSSVIGLRGR